MLSIFTSKSLKSVFLAVIMISMSLSAGIVEVNKAPWLIEDAPSELEPPAQKPMYSGPADWELVPSSAAVTATKDTAISDVTFTWTGWSSGMVNSTSSVYTSGDSAHYSSIVIDSNDKAHIVFYRDDNSNLMYSTNKSGSWATSSIETSNNVGKYCNLAIDSNDGLHVSYEYNTGTSLKYAYKSASSSSWSKTTIDNTGGKFTSIAIDSNDKPHIAYRDSGGDLGYAEKTGSSWSFSSVQSAGDIAFTSIAIDSDDHIHIAYYDANNKDMFHFTDTSGSWVRTNLEDIGTNTGGTALDIAIDPTTDEPGISYFDMNATSLKYTYYTGTSWSATTVENSADYGRFNSIAYDSLGNVHISHELNGADDLYYSSDKTGSWVSTAVHTASSAGTYTAIAVDSNDDIHIAYRYNTGADLYHATVQGHNPGSVTRTGVTGATCTVTPALPAGLSLTPGTCTLTGTPTVGKATATYNLTATSSTGLSKNGEFTIQVFEPPLISYSPSSFTLTKGTAMSPTATPTNTGGAIPSGIVDSGSSLGSHTSIALDSNGYKHISYYHATNKDLMYATDKSGSWVTTSIDTSGIVGHYTSIAIDSNDDVHISYYDSTNGDLKYATDKSGSWVTTSIDTSGIVGHYTSIAIDSNDDVHISYYDTTNGDLKYATNKSGSWVTTSIDTSGTSIFSSYTSIGIDSNDDVHISYYDYTNGDLKYATDKSGSWVTTSIDTSGIVGHDTSIAIDSNDDVHISYYDYTNGDLKYATDKSGSWVTTSIDTSGNVGAYTSIAIDSNDDVHISHQDFGNGDLKYATDKSGSWVTTSIDTSGNVGAYTSIAIDSNDDVHISYYHITNTELKYIGLDSSSNVLGYSVSPALPAGLSLDLGTGEISGTPTATSSSATYTITARNSGGTGTTTVTIVVNDAVPVIAYSPSSLTLTKGTAMTPTTPASSGGSVTSWEISPAIPAGMAFSASTGAISGTPSVLQTTAVTYTIWANNSGGNTSTQMNITINDQVASITYPSTVEISNDRAMTTVTPTNSGGAVSTWEIHPSLPTGLNFGSSNGSIWGTPTGLLENVTYTVYANNSGGSPSTTFILGLNWTLTPSAEGALITRNSSIASDITWEWDYDPLEAQNLSLVTGEWNTCALDSNQNVFCWGRNGNGQIGNGQTGTAACGTSGHKCKDIPTATNDLGSDVISLAFGHQHACGLLDTGAVKCWGRNNAGQLGTSGGDKDTPQTINLGSGRTATSIYAGGHYTCAILDDASVKCWGQNDQGQLGIGSTSNTNTPTTINTLGSGRTAVSLATAFDSVCALLDDGSVKCWGSDFDGQLGNGGTNADLSSPPSSAINLGTSRTAKAITGGEFHFCAILDDDSIKCWGQGTDGKLGTGSTGDRSTPTSTSGSFASGRYAVAIDAGYDHTCVLLDNGDMTCWGSDADGQLGNGASSSSTVSSLSSNIISLGTGRTAISISAGGTHTCAQLDNGQLKCWGNRADGQVGDNGNFNNPSDRTSPSSVSSNNHGGNTYLNTGVMPSSAVTGATCEISPSLPTGLSLTAGTCAITGTPTVTATNATYTVWANVSGQSFSGQIWLEVGLNAPDISYSSSTYTYTKDIEITSLIPSNVGGEVTTWAINATLPSGLTFETSNGTIWGTPDTITSATTYTIWANNSADSDSFTITFTVNAAPPNFYYGGASGGGAHTLVLYLDQTMNPLTPTHASGGGAITSCSSSPSLPSGLSLSSTCVLSGTPDATATGALYTITGTNTGGSDTASLYIEIRSSGGTLSVTPSNTEGSVNSSISDITMSYAHQLSNYGWTSGVSNTTTTLSNNFLTAGGTHLLGIDSGDQGEMVVVYAHNDTSSASGTYSLGMMYRWGGTWTETILDTGTDTGHHPSVAIDRQGAIHIAYIDDHNDELRYATNASGSWVFTTLGSSTYDNDDGRGTAIVVHPITDVVHIVTTINDNTYRDLQYHTNEDGSWVNMTITNTLSDEGHDPAMAMDGDGNLHVAYYCDDGCSDLRMSSRINGVWQNETVASTLNIGNDPDITIDSQGTIHIVSQYLNNKRIYLHSGTPGSWTEQTGLSGGTAHWPVVSVDSNDAVHISYHFGNTQKDVMYMTNASGSWSTASMIEGYGGWGSEMAIDDNDDIFIANLAVGIWNELQLTTVKGSGQGLTVRPIYDISPMLPDGLTMNWRNGTVSGTPTEALANTTFTVTVTALGATTTGTFTLFITGAPGAIAYSDISGTKGTAITPVTPAITTNGTTGSVTSWAINASLPSGLTFETSNGTIWGTPTVIVSGEVFTIWANNSVGSKSTTVNITVNDAVPVLVYSPSSFTLTKGTAMTTVTPTTSGGTIVSWSISPTLPTGLAFDTSTGAISGTPTVLSVSAAYTVTATNTGGSDTAAVTIVVNDEVPTIAYSPENLTLTKNQTSTDLPLTATVTGSGTITSWAISPALPSGLSFGTSNGTIWGTPTSLMTLKTFTISASNSGGSVNATVNITVNDEAPDISYNPDWFELTKGVAMSPTATPINAGGAIPTSILESTGEVGRGTSLAIDANGYKHVTYFDDTNYVLKYATDASGSWVNITLNTITYHQQSSSSSIVIDSGGVLHVAYSGASGNLTYATCSSTCTSNASWTFVEIDDSGSASGSPSLAIDSNNTMHISYIEYNVGTTPETLKYATCSASCTTASSWSNITVDNSFNTANHADIAIDSNDGLHISYFKQTYSNPGYYYATCTSSCNATSSWNTLGLGWGAGLSGLNPTSIVVDSNDVVHFASSYFSGSSGGNGFSIRSCSASCTTGSSAWSSSQVDTSSAYFTIGYISIVVDSNDGLHIAYGIHGQNVDSALHYASCSSSCPSGSSSTSSWSITEIDGTVEAGTISIAIGPNDGVGIVYQDTTNDNIRDVSIDSSANVYGYSVSPDLPAGLSLDIATGEISGTPTALSTNTTYTITVRNSGGTNTTTITIVVNDQVPTIAYSPNDLDLTNNTASSDLPLSPTITGSGTITSWAISPSVPSGLVFSASTGVLSGTPTELLTRSMFTITGTNTGGTATAYINITIVDEVPTIAYSPNDLDMTNNTASSDLPLSPTITGSGEFTSWAISPSVPSGLSFSTSTGVLSGTPTELLTWSMFTITGTNTGGTATAYINITIVDQVPFIAYSPNDLNMTNNTASSDLPLSPTVTGSGEIVIWAISPSVPSGLSFSTSTGVLSGTPTELLVRSMFTITATNTGGTATAYINITIVDEVPTIAYSPNDLDMTNNTASSDLPLSPTITGSGEIVSWAISPSVPSGLAFSTSTGVLSGTPTELLTRSMFTITATNTGGTATAYINITIVDEVPTIAYSPNDLDLMNNTASSDLPLSPTITGSGEFYVMGH